MTSRVQKGSAIFRPLAKQRSRPAPAPASQPGPTSSPSQSSAPNQLQTSPQFAQPQEPFQHTQAGSAPLSSFSPLPPVVSANSSSIAVPTSTSNFVAPPVPTWQSTTAQVPSTASQPPTIRRSHSQVPIVVGTSRPTSTVIGVPLGAPQSLNSRPQTHSQHQNQHHAPNSGPSGIPIPIVAQNLSQPSSITTERNETAPVSTQDTPTVEPPRTKRKRKGAQVDDGVMEEEEDDSANDDEYAEEAGTSKRKGPKNPRAKSTGAKRPRKKSHKASSEDSAEPEDEDGRPSVAPKRARKSKSKTQTPPFDVNADPGTELDPTMITMATLCDDTGQGRVSSKAAEILTNHENWKKDRRERRARMKERMERKKYGLPEDEEDERGGGKEKEAVEKEGDKEIEDNAHASGSRKGSEAPVNPIPDNPDAFDYGDLQHSRFNVQVRIGPNGETIIDEESLVVDRVEGEQGEGEYENVVESDMTKFTNSGTYGKRFRGSRWSKAETELFYDALAQHGENYELISYVLPGRDRKSCKNKFKAEDKRDPARINHCLNNRVPVDMKTLSRMTGKDFSGPTPEILVPQPPVTLRTEEQAPTNPLPERGRKDKPGNNSTSKRSRSRTTVPEAGVEVLGDVDGYALMDDD